MDREQEKKAGKVYHVGMTVVGLVFIVFWCIMALYMGAWFMLIFGIPVFGLVAYRLVMGLRMMSEKKDPPAGETPRWEPPRADGRACCPYCGGTLEEDYAFCPYCGRRDIKK